MFLADVGRLHSTIIFIQRHHSIHFYQLYEFNSKQFSANVGATSRGLLFCWLIIMLKLLLILGCNLV